MSKINEATPAEWDRMFRKRDVPTFKEAVVDNVAQPTHYNSGDIECIDAIQASMSKDEYAGYLKGNTLKYLWRYKYKGKPREDLLKAQVYLTWLIAEATEQ